MIRAFATGTLVWVGVLSLGVYFYEPAPPKPIALDAVPSYSIKAPVKWHNVPEYSWASTLEAIRHIETGGLADGGLGAVGDGGRASGPYQIHAIYHTDAAERDSALFSYSEVAYSAAYSERVIYSYMGRYAAESRDRLLEGKGMLVDVETIARIHNGGPKGKLKRATLPYWGRVHETLLSHAH
mgnify:CR=1 FL=1